MNLRTVGPAKWLFIAFGILAVVAAAIYIVSRLSFAAETGTPIANNSSACKKANGICATFSSVLNTNDNCVVNGKSGLIKTGICPGNSRVRCCVLENGGGNQDSTPKDITSKSKFTPSSNTKSFKYATDGKLSTAWKSGTGEQNILIAVGSGFKQLKGIYIRWNSVPPLWDLFSVASDGSQTLVTSGGENAWLTEWIPVTGSRYDSNKFKLVSKNPNIPLNITEISLFLNGAPYYAPMWQNLDGRADVMVVVSHPDDEDLYMGPIIPLSVNEGKKPITVFMTYGADVRRFEGMESVWSLGEKYYPVMRKAIDKKTSTKEAAMKYWPEEETIGYIVEQIRKFKPSVIVTHDIKGEYGHGAHKLTSYAVQKAFEAAGDANKYKDSADKYGVWEPSKLYIHLYSPKSIFLSVKQKLDAFSGLTVYQVVSRAYSRHKSQLPGRSLPTSGAYDMQKFGLFLTKVGDDILKKSIFENITQ